MYTVIENKDDIKKYQDMFVKIFQDGCKDKYENRRIGYPGGSNECDVYWWSELESWFASIKKTEGGNRYLNWFGFEDPKDNTNLSINGEISISIEGSRTAGKFVKNGDKILIAHNGDFKKNRKSIKAPFLDYCENSINRKIIQIENESLVVIAELPSDKTKSPDFQNKVIGFIRDADRIKKNTNVKVNDKNKSKDIQKRNNVNKKAPLIKKQQNESSYEVAQRVREIILSINEICKLHKKKDIFDQAALFKLWGNIENTCKSKNDFKGFAENLYKLLRETTRDINPNKKDKNDSHYLFRIPSNFLKDGTSTKHFWDIVNTLRHYFVHDEIGRIANVYEEFLGSSSGPESSEDYSKFQIELLKRFENAMKELLEIVKNDGKIILQNP